MKSAVIEKKPDLIKRLKNYRKYLNNLKANEIFLKPCEKYIDKPSDYPSLYHLAFNKKVRGKQNKDCLSQAIFDVINLETEENQNKILGEEAFNLSKFYLFELSNKRVEDYIEEARYVLEDWLINSHNLKEDIIKILEKEKDIPIKLIVAEKLRKGFFPNHGLKEIIFNYNLNRYYQNEKD